MTGMDNEGFRFPAACQLQVSDNAMASCPTVPRHKVPASAMLLKGNKLLGKGPDVLLGTLPMLVIFAATLCLR